MFKNSHLRLLMKLVGMERLAPSVDETPDSSWIFGSRVTADELEESLEYINRAEFDPPTFDNNKSAEDQLRRKSAPRKKATFDDDDDNDADLEDDFLFPAGGPTVRKVIGEEDVRKRKTIRRRRKKTDDDGNELEGPTEEELDKRARLRRQNELEKARRIKSDVYVHASDDETDDEKDRAFFQREEATRKRIQNAVLNSARSTASDAAGAQPKRKLAVLIDDDEDGAADVGLSQESHLSGSELSVLGAYRSRKRRRSFEGAMSTDEDEGEDEDDGGEVQAIVAKKHVPRPRQHAGFLDSSDEEDDGHQANGNVMNVDEDMPLSILSEQTGGKIQLNGSVLAGAGMGVAETDDDDDVLPAKKRARPKTGFVVDSDDE